MANPEQLEILKQGAEAWNQWREGHHEATISLSGAQLSGARLAGIDLSRADLRGADLRDANLMNARLWHTRFNGADLMHAVLSRADLQLASLDEANLEGADLEAANLRGAVLWQAKLNGAVLKEADLNKAHLNQAELNRADLQGAVLRLADLRAASLGGAYLSGADLQEADLKQADLSDADLAYANLTFAGLKGATFTGAKMGRTVFAFTNLSEVPGLETCQHSAPSSLDSDTLTRSRGRIPEVFLRGCGLSDWEIESAKLFNPDLTNQQIIDINYRVYDLRATRALQVSPLFISYSRADADFVDRLGDCLTEKGVRYWRDTHDMQSGRIETQIDRAIRQNPVVLLVLSEHSLSSDWVEHEVRAGRSLEKDLGRDVLCPVALDESWKESRWPRRLMEQVMEYNILDFSGWQNKAKFNGMFGKLLGGLELFYKK